MKEGDERGNNMNLMNIENLTKSYTDRKLFDGASFSLQEGEKVGVIGINGTGKTTLLRMIMGEEETDGGTVTIANHVVVCYLPQHPVFTPDKSSLECILEGNVTDENRWSIESESQSNDDTSWNERFHATGGTIIWRAEKTPCIDFGITFPSRYSFAGRAYKPFG
jgi:ATPase subunit of ABC transporter with duplicated ATPase domains